MLPGRTVRAGLIRFVRDVLRAGAVLDMELRVSSRRRRTFVLRLAFVLGLALFVFLIWRDAVGRVGLGGAFVRARMAEAGKEVIYSVVWFLYVAGPAVAILLTSDSFATELRRGSLSALLSTPLSLEQIVLGKFISRMTQLLCLLAAALPVLAAVRVFGGVPWSYAAGGMAMVLAASAFAGAASMRSAARHGRSIHAIPAAVAMVAVGCFPISVWLAICSDRMLAGRPSWALTLWPVPVAATLAAAWRVLKKCARELPMHTLFPPDRDPDPTDRPFVFDRCPYLPPVPFDPGEKLHHETPPSPLDAAQDAFVRSTPIPGSPIVWRATRKNWATWSLTSAFLLALLMGYFYACCYPVLGTSRFHLAVLSTLLVPSMLMLAILSARAIASERESGCWPLLLATPLSDWRIFADKVTVILRRCAPAGCIAAGHCLLFVAIGRLDAIVLPLAGLIAVEVVVFLVGVGLYCSARWRSNTVATLVALSVSATLWAVVPLAAPALGGWWGRHSGALVFRAIVRGANPVAQLAESLDLSVRSGGGKPAPPAEVQGAKYLPRPGALVPVSAVVYIAAGGLLGWRAKCRFRRHVF